MKFVIYLNLLNTKRRTSYQCLLSNYALLSKKFTDKYHEFLLHTTYLNIPSVDDVKFTLFVAPVLAKCAVPTKNQAADKKPLFTLFTLLPIYPITLVTTILR